MAVRMQARPFVAAALVLLAGELAGAQTGSRRCEATLDGLGSRYADCLLRGEGRAPQSGPSERVSAAQVRCQERFERRSDRVFRNLGTENCTPAELVAALASRGDSCKDDRAARTSRRAYLQKGSGGVLLQSTLTLSGVGAATGWLQDRPYRDAGRLTIPEFVGLFSDPTPTGLRFPAAEFQCQANGERVVQAVRLTSVEWNPRSQTLTYAVTALSSVPGEELATVHCDGKAHLVVGAPVADGRRTCATRDLCYRAGFCAYQCSQWGASCTQPWHAMCADPNAYVAGVRMAPFVSAAEAYKRVAAIVCMDD